MHFNNYSTINYSTHFDEPKMIIGSLNLQYWQPWHSLHTDLGLTESVVIPEFHLQPINDANLISINFVMWKIKHCRSLSFHWWIKKPERRSSVKWMESSLLFEETLQPTVFLSWPVHYTHFLFCISSSLIYLKWAAM